MYHKLSYIPKLWFLTCQQVLKIELLFAHVSNFPVPLTVYRNYSIEYLQPGLRCTAARVEPKKGLGVRGVGKSEAHAVLVKLVGLWRPSNET